MSPDAIEWRSLTLRYGNTPVIRDLALSVRPGETLALLGPSGSGKTTLLYASAGFLAPAAGEIRIAGRLVAGPRVSVPPEDREVAVVFQHYALWPHLTARETVAYPLRRRGLPSRSALARADELLDRMGVAHLAERRPAELSGGEQQRIGVARALAREGELLLLDEPTAHLDTPLRAALQAELADQRTRSGAAAVYATHDVAEALAVADRVALLRTGRLVQVGTPRQIYERPVDLWAARLSGAASMIVGDLRSLDDRRALVEVAGCTVALHLDGGDEQRQGPVRLLVRPDWAALGGELSGRVRNAWYRGPHTDYRVDTPAGQIEIREPGMPRAAVGEAVAWQLRRAFLLEETEEGVSATDAS